MIKPKINQILANYIECPVCGSEKSYLLPEILRYGKFSWQCERCSTLWRGVLLPDGDIAIAKAEADEPRRFVLVELSSEYVPLALYASRPNVPPDASAFTRAAAALNARPRMHILYPALPDEEHNPQCLPQYRANTF